jgi:hypothetical protein
MVALSREHIGAIRSIREEVTQSTLDRLAHPNFDNQKGGPKDPGYGHRSERRTMENLKKRYLKEGVWTDRHAGYLDRGRPRRNRRTVWTIATESYAEEHFATFPRKLVQPCILAGCPEHACPKCGAPWVKEVEREMKPAGRSEGEVYTAKAYASPQSAVWGKKRNLGGDGLATTVTGEHPTCTCGLPAIGGTTLDPFGGSGTTAEVALEYGRRAILIELKPEYVELQKRRIAPVAGRPMLDFAGGAS